MTVTVTLTLATIALFAALIAYQRKMVTGRIYAAATATIVLVLILWIVNWPDVRSIDAAGLKLELGMARADEVLAKLEEAIKRADTVERQLSEVQASVTRTGGDVETLLSYGRTATLNVYGVSGRAVAPIVETSPLSELLKPIWRVKDNQIIPQCDGASRASLEEVNRRSPTFPFAYYAKAYCMRQAGDPGWREVAQQAVVILQRTTKIEGHHEHHDAVLAEIEEWLRSSKP